MALKYIKGSTAAETALMEYAAKPHGIPSQESTQSKQLALSKKQQAVLEFWIAGAMVETGRSHATVNQSKSQFRQPPAIDTTRMQSTWRSETLDPPRIDEAKLTLRNRQVKTLAPPSIERTDIKEANVAAKLIRPPSFDEVRGDPFDPSIFNAESESGPAAKQVANKSNHE